VATSRLRGPIEIVPAKDLPGAQVLVVDDHELIRDGLRTLLNAEDDLRVVGEAKTANEALALTRQLEPDVIVLDVGLPDRPGVEICAEIRRLQPETRILVFSGLSEGSALADAAKAGADGFVSKGAPNDEIVDAVRRVAAGAAVVGADSAAAILQHARTSPTAGPSLEPLSKRERQVLGLLSLGLTNREIAGRLFISEKTIRNQVSQILHKLGLRHRTEAALFAAPIRDQLGIPD
jgi:two-component system, NarL family, response regulator DevR